MNAHVPAFKIESKILTILSEDTRELVKAATRPVRL